MNNFLTHKLLVVIFSLCSFYAVGEVELPVFLELNENTQVAKLIIPKEGRAYIEFRDGSGLLSKRKLQLSETASANLVDLANNPEMLFTVKNSPNIDERAIVDEPPLTLTKFEIKGSRNKYSVERITLKVKRTAFEEDPTDSSGKKRLRMHFVPIDVNTAKFSSVGMVGEKAKNGLVMKMPKTSGGGIYPAEGVIGKRVTLMLVPREVDPEGASRYAVYVPTSSLYVDKGKWETKPNQKSAANVFSHENQIALTTDLGIEKRNVFGVIPFPVPQKINEPFSDEVSNRISRHVDDEKNSMYQGSEGKVQPPIPVLQVVSVANGDGSQKINELNRSWDEEKMAQRIRKHYISFASSTALLTALHASVSDPSSAKFLIPTVASSGLAGWLLASDTKMGDNRYILHKDMVPNPIRDGIIYGTIGAGVGAAIHGGCQVVLQILGSM